METIYTIPKGRHRAKGLRFGIHNSKERLNFSVIFDRSCIYDLFSKSDNEDINKLYGISWGLHHKNSFRIGWRTDQINKGKIELFAYCYNNGIRKFKLLGNISVYLKMNFYIDFDYENNQIIISDSKIEQRIDFEFPKCKLGYYLYPYFGGNNKSPHTMQINIS